jgi:hypothetical protein
MKRHGFDTVSFTLGLIFLTFVAMWLLSRVADIGLPSIGWFLAGGLTLLGALGVILTVYLHSDRTTGQPSSPPALTEAKS